VNRRFTSALRVVKFLSWIFVAVTAAAALRVRSPACSWDRRKPRSAVWTSWAAVRILFW
jgi:hypothetical protein